MMLPITCGGRDGPHGDRQPWRLSAHVSRRPSDDLGLTTWRGSMNLRDVRWLGVVSDTHGDIPNTQQAVRMFESRRVQLVVHCGDIGSPEIPPLFAPWPTHYVLGNVDGNVSLLRSAIEEAGQTLHGRFGNDRRRRAQNRTDSQRRHRSLSRSDRQPRLGPGLLRTHPSGQMPPRCWHRRAEPRRRPLRLSAVGGPGRPRNLNVTSIPLA